jgi:hypothetical protein
MNSPAERLQIIEDSMTCMAHGFCSLIPLLGIPYFVLAIKRYHRVRIASSGEWNPGARYAFWGMVLASIGGFISTLLYGVVFVGILDAL